MKKAIYSSILLLFAFFASEAKAQYSNLTLDDCRTLALKNNFALKSSETKIKASLDMLASYKTNFLPNFSLNSAYLYSTSKFETTIEGGYLPTFTPNPATGELVPNIGGVDASGNPIFNQYAYMPDMDFKLKASSIFNIGAQASQAIYLGGKVTNSVKLANLGVDIANLNKRKTEAETIIACDEAFFAFIKVQELLLSAEKYQEVITEFHRQVNNAYKAGMSKRNDLMKIEVKLNEAKLMTFKAQNGLTLAKMNLCYTLGLPLTTSNISLTDDFNLDQTINPTNLDVSNRPEYKMLEKQIEAKKLETKLTKSDFLPSISALASYGYTYGAKFNNSTLLSNAGFTGGIMVSVPIFHWGEGKRKISANKREVEIAQNQFDDLSQKMTLELMQSINIYQEAVLEVKLMENSVAQAEENMRLSKNQYSAGMETVADYLESQALWQKAMSDLVESKSTQRIAYSKYLKTSGR